MNYDAYGNPIKPKSSGVLLPVLLALLVSGAGNYWLWKERSKLTGELFTATSKLGATEAVQKELSEKVAKLEAEHDALVEAKEQAIKDVQAKALELAKLKDDVAGVESPEGDEAAGDKGKAGGKAEPATKDEKNGKADKADKKAEAKAKAKAKKKKEKAESGRKKEKEAAPSEREL
jgi:hypothetical protein